ncbi:MAG: DEAD/DEAH box helicase [Thermoguttaceae bacterium]|nr:DEAD/DEAH box helicase [Thermoguttaceae bacterium]
MSGAVTTYRRLCTELKNYIRSQYYRKIPILLRAFNELSESDYEGLLYQKPYIESSPVYQTTDSGITRSSIPARMKKFFEELTKAGLGVFPTPFNHQIQALERAVQGDDLFVSTGTGSGKTECFIWPLLAKLADEACCDPNGWTQRGVRTLIMYPMNALVSDQISRLRRLIGDQEGKFAKIFRDYSSATARRPQFGMYTGRTPYAGEKPVKADDKKLEHTLRSMFFPQKGNEHFTERLILEGKIPAKSDMESFLKRLAAGKHIPNDDDAELITRFEMQRYTPDILITNYSMLEYMLLRPREAHIWDDTRTWLEMNPEHRLLFIIDEAHMYRGAAGGEVALLIRRLFHKLGISRDRVQFILTTASMPASSPEDRESVQRFARDLTSSPDGSTFQFLTGDLQAEEGATTQEIPLEDFIGLSPEKIEAEPTRLEELNRFWGRAVNQTFPNLESAYKWMYDHLMEFRPFAAMVEQCRGSAVSLMELAAVIFPQEPQEKALEGLAVLLAIAPLARDGDRLLFPARMHMLFRGIHSAYACTNDQCPHARTAGEIDDTQDGALTLGEILFSDGRPQCPICDSAAYELINDRRCGALFFRGYVLASDLEEHSSQAYLWQHPGQLQQDQKKLREIHLYIPPRGFHPTGGGDKTRLIPCYLDIKSGFINFRDDSPEGKPGFRKLYYSEYVNGDRPDTLTFYECPHCRHKLSSMQLSPLEMRGNEAFFNLVHTQFEMQPPVDGKDKKLFPNQGRKVLLFSDSRQRAAKLARDMSEVSEIQAIRQLFVLAIDRMEQTEDVEPSLNLLYSFLCLVAGEKEIQLFAGEARKRFTADRDAILNEFRDEPEDFEPEKNFSSAPEPMRAALLRLFCGGFNTLYESAVCWIEPTKRKLRRLKRNLDKDGVEITEQGLLDLFNAWMMAVVCDEGMALGHTIDDDTRESVRRKFGKYGLDDNWSFSDGIRKRMNWTQKNGEEESYWHDLFQDEFLVRHNQDDNGRLYVDLNFVKPRFDMEHPWHKCRDCSEVTPFLLKEGCPCCGSTRVVSLSKDDLSSLAFWRQPVEAAIKGEPIHWINTEEHTAQLSYRDQRDDLWSTTEQYELRFRDIVDKDEIPVDILSCTTTMEVGIDIGSLVAIGLRNIPPMRENYQQRAGRAGRRGAGLSTIVTFCENGPHDQLYFNNPAAMFRGDPRRPWIDVHSEKLLHRHLNLVTLRDYLDSKQESIDQLSGASFIRDHLEAFFGFLERYNPGKSGALIGIENFGKKHLGYFKEALRNGVEMLRQRFQDHPELFTTVNQWGNQTEKKLLDILYEEGLIPTFSFPKDVVSTYISGDKGVKYEVDRGLDIAISEYAPGRAIVVDKQTYQIGGIYNPATNPKGRENTSPASSFVNDKNYLKPMVNCPFCGWFGLADDRDEDECPLCGASLVRSRSMLKPWGFAPRDGRSIHEAQLSEEYSSASQPIYSTLPEKDDIHRLPESAHIRMASRTNQRIIMLNQGRQGFMVCTDCGAAFPGQERAVLDSLKRPYPSFKKCSHPHAINVNIGCDFITDMLVLEFALDPRKIDTNGLWLLMASRSLAEALRLTISRRLDIEYAELNVGTRTRRREGKVFVDLFLYDSLSSGAGYAVSTAEEMPSILAETGELLAGCQCGSACHHCLKHYQNRFFEHLLDRQAALQLLNWGNGGELAAQIPLEMQRRYLKPLEDVLKERDCPISADGESILVAGKRLIVHPAMWNPTQGRGTIYVSDALLRYCKPLAYGAILEGAGKTPYLFS